MSSTNQTVHSVGWLGDIEFLKCSLLDFCICIAASQKVKGHTWSHFTISKPTAQNEHKTFPWEKTHSHTSAPCRRKHDITAQNKFWWNFDSQQRCCWWRLISHILVFELSNLFNRLCNQHNSDTEKQLHILTQTGYADSQNQLIFMNTIVILKTWIPAKDAFLWTHWKFV